MRAGVIQQVDRPQVLYERPDNLFVAAFIGSPAMNLVEATVAGDTVSFAGIELPLAPGRRPARDGHVILGIRPESFEDAGLADPSLPSMEVKVDVLEELGSESHVMFTIDAPRLEAEDIRAAADHEDGAALVDDRAAWTARVQPKSAARVGAPIRLAVDTPQLYFFDPDSGASLTAGAQPAPAVVG